MKMAHGHCADWKRNPPDPHGIPVSEYLTQCRSNPKIAQAMDRMLHKINEIKRGGKLRDNIR